MPEGGRLVLVVGPSGVGKDTLIEAAKNLGLSGVRVVKREITRPADLGAKTIRLSAKLILPGGNPPADTP